MTTPIKELRIRAERSPSGYSQLLVKINDGGQLVLDGADGGERVRQVSGDWDYEFSWTVPAEWKGTVLLHLMKERFPKESEFSAWCEERGIPCKFWSWE